MAVRELTTNVKVRIDEDTKEWLEREGRDADRPVGAVIRLAIREYRRRREAEDGLATKAAFEVAR